MFDHVVDRDESNKRASERGAWRWRGVDVHIWDTGSGDMVHGGRREGGGEEEGSFLPGWRIAFIIMEPWIVTRREAERTP